MASEECQAGSYYPAGIRVHGIHRGGNQQTDFAVPFSGANSVLGPRGILYTDTACLQFVPFTVWLRLWAVYFLLEL